MRYEIAYSSEYEEWYLKQLPKSRFQIRDRLDNIESDGHFGEHRQVHGEIWELKWRNGRRIYFTHSRPKEILLLLGGNKNGQTKDIRKAKNILKKYY